MHDPRKPRPLKPRTLSILIVDTQNFSRGLVAEILRNLNITNVHSARSAEIASALLLERPVDIVLLSTEEAASAELLGFARELRRHDDDRLRRLPVILITNGLTRQLVIAGRDAGVDEFLAKPISPAAMLQRLQMVVETPRPFIDCSVYLGPCRRRKNPADYYGARRRAGERGPERKAVVDEDEVAQQTPIRLALAQLRQTCQQLRASRPEALAAAMIEFRRAKDIAVEKKDHALHSGLAAFEAYVGVTTPLGQLDQTIVATAITALEQLAALPTTYVEARDSVAIALGKAIQRKITA